MDSPRVVNRAPRNRVGLVVVVVACVAALGGCGWPEQEQVARDSSEIEGRVAEHRGSRPEKPGFRALRTASGPYLAVKPVVRERARLPEDLRADDGVVVPLGDEPGEDVLAGRIEVAAGISVRFVGSAPGVGAIQGGRWNRSRTDDLTLQGGLYVGPLDRLLDEWTRAEGYEWRYRPDEAMVEVVRWKTKIFQVNALTGETTYDARIATSGSGGEDTSGSTRQSIRSKSEYKPWADIETEIKAVLGAEGKGLANARGESAVVSPSSATVTVTGSPGTINRVRRYLDHLNRNILRPIILSAHLYALRLDRGSNLELGLGGVIPEIFGSNLEVNLDGGTISIVKPTSAAHSSLDATVTALRSIGTATRVLSADIPSLNGQPTEFYDVYDHRYLKEIETTIRDNVETFKLTPGEVWSGFGLSYVGRIVGNDAVLARITVTIQDAPNFTVFGPAGNQVQLPSAGRRAVVVTQHIERGAVLLLSGFSDRQVSENRAGTFDPDIPLPDGERKGLLDRVETVLLVTADVGPPMGILEVEEGPGWARSSVNGVLRMDGTGAVPAGPGSAG